MPVGSSVCHDQAAGLVRTGSPHSWGSRIGLRRGADEVRRIVDTAAAPIARHLRMRAERARADRLASTTRDAITEPGATPFSTQFSSAGSMSNWFGPGPPPQWCMPGTR